MKRNFTNASLSLSALTAIMCMALFSNDLMAQSVGIASTTITPDAQSILDIQSTSKGVLLPRMTSAQRTAISPTNGADFGLSVYDTDTDSYWYWDGTVWQEIPNTSGIVTTLDGAYDGGGSGLGRIITADAGAVDIQGAGGILVTGKSAFGTSVDANYQLSVLNSNNSIKIGGSSIGIRAEVQAVGEDAFYASHSSTGNSEAYYVVRGELSGWSTNGYLGYHSTSGAGENYAVYGSGGTYAGYFDGNTNITGEFHVNGSPGTAGQVLMSAGSGSDVTWGAAPGDISAVTAGDGLTGGGTTGAVTLTAAADNGLNVDAVADKIQLGGPLTEATSIALGNNNLTFNLSGTGDFVIQDGGTNHFEIVDNDGDALFGGDITLKDGSTSGTTLIDFTDAGTGSDDGRIQLYANGTINHTIHADGNTVFNEQGFDRDFKIESDNEPNLFYLDGGTDRVGLGTATPAAQLHTTGTLRFANYTNGFLQVNGTGDVSVATGSSLFTAGTGLSWSGTTLNSVWTQASNDIYSNNSGNVGIGTTTPDAKLNVGDASGAALYLTREDATTVSGDVLGSLLFDSTDDTFPSTTDASAGIRAFASQDHGNSNKGGHLTFFTKNNVGNGIAATEHMRITAAGNVGIGDVTPDAKLDVDAASGNLLILANSGTQRALVDINGNLTISGKMNSNGIEELSDRRFKTNISPLSSVLNKVLKIEGVTYNWRQDEFPEKAFGDRTEIGFIAQELEKYFPELVNTDKDGYKSVQYSHMVPVLLEAIKEQQQQIELMSNQLRSLTVETTELLYKMATLSAEISSIKGHSITVEEKEADVKAMQEKLQRVGSPAPQK